MGRTLYGYADKIWEVNRKFEYTGEPEQFTLDPKPPAPPATMNRDNNVFDGYVTVCNGAAVAV